MESKRKDRLLPPLMRLIRLNKGQYPWLAAMLLTTTLGGAAMVAMAWVFAGMVDATLGKNAMDFAGSALVMACLLILSVGLAAVSRYAAGRYANGSVRGIRDRLGEKFARAALPWLEKRRTGDLLSLLGNDVGQLSGFFEEHLRWFVADWIRFALSLAYMLVLNPWLTLATVAYIPIGSMLTMLASKPVQRLAERQNAELGGANAIAQDAVAGQAEVKAFHMGPWLSGRYAAALRGWLGAGLRNACAQAGVDAATITNLILPFAMMSFLGLWFVSQGQLTGGELVAFMNVSNGIINPLMSLTWRLSEMRRAAGVSARLDEVLDAPGERRDGGDHPIAAGVPILSFRNLSFSYERAGADGGSARQQVFQGLDLEIARGETVAVVGHSGSGKSTLLKLAAGLYQPDAGQVLFGGTPLDAWGLGSARAHMAIVDQDIYLFPGSIAENVACGAVESGGSDRDAVAGAIRLARLEQFVQSLPEGPDTPVGERGGRLSGGQRQRVAIARAALRDAELLLMDEPTSALDTTTENEIQRELLALMAGRTVLIVTHKLSLTRHADRIVVLDGGGVAEQGTHGQLMAARGRYYELYSRQDGQEGGEAA